MEKNNNKISGFQFASITFALVNSLFVGIGISNIFTLSKQDSWLVSLVSMILSILPLIILFYVIGYKPNKNIFEKNIDLFGKIIGNIINFILVMFVLLLIVIVITATSIFASTIYLTKTPYLVIAGVFIAIAIYAVIKGIESISRLSEILFFLSIVLIFITTASLLPIFHFDELRPILIKGFNPLIKNSVTYISYSLTPLLLMTIIPKENIINNKKYHWKFFGAFILASINLFSVFFLIPGIYSAKLTEFLRFPAYYALRKIDVGKVFNNVENFLSIHWFFDNFILITMSLYFISKYLKFIFKKTKEKKINFMIIIVALISIIIPKFIFNNPLSILEFMKKYFTIYISLPILVIFLILSILIFFKRKKEKS